MKDIGFGIKGKDTDQKSPFSGKVKVRGRTFVGTIIAAKMQKTATVEWTRRVMIPKYERYMNKRSKVKAHIPEALKVEEGDIVKIMECRKLSKTKNFVIVENYGKEKGFAQKMERLEEGKKRVVKESKAEPEQPKETEKETEEATSELKEE